METKKLKKLNINDFVKSNSEPRLQSLRLPRDLSLGGTKLSKKSYTPNLNVVRNKTKAKELIRNREKPSKGSRISHLPSDRFVQSTGVFSEGVGDSVGLPKVNVSVRERKKGPPIKQEPEKVYKRIDNRVFEEIVKCEDEDSDTDKETAVPFKPIEWCTNKLLEEVMKEEVKPAISDIDWLLPKEYTDSGESSKMPLTLWQLPDSFSFRRNADASNKNPADCKLSNLPEGKIGRICVRRSGRVTVYIGNLEYELEPAGFESFTENVVAVNVSGPQESTATVLGNVDSRYLLNPLWTSLLD